MEIWKDIAGFEGMYQASTKGRVRSLDRIDARNRKLKGKVLHPKRAAGNYKQVCLCKGGVHHYIAIHRLVALTFIPNPENKPTVNHIDENNQNNNVENLEWATYMENAHYGTRIERCYKNRDYKSIISKATATRSARGMFRKIKQYDCNMNFIAEYISAAEAGRKTGLSSSSIMYALDHYNGTKPFKGYIWIEEGKND